MSTIHIIDKKFEINRTKIKGSCQSGGKVVPHNSKNDLPLAEKRLLLLSLYTELLSLTLSKAFFP